MFGCTRWASDILRSSNHVRHAYQRFTQLSSYRHSSRRARTPPSASYPKQVVSIKRPAPLHHVAMRNLRGLLAGTSPLDQSALHAAYVASKPHWHHLTCSEYSDLIAIFGALSTYSCASRLPGSATFALSDSQRSLLAGASPQAFANERWDLVLSLGADQQAIGRRTSDSDRYWLMLAHLNRCLRGCAHTCPAHNHNHLPHSVRRIPGSDSDKLPTGCTHLADAHEHYIVLAHNHLDEGVHHAYLYTLLTIYTRHPSRAVQAHLAISLTRLVADARFRFGPGLARLVWLQVFAAVDFTATQRQALLDALALRHSTLRNKRTSLSGVDTQYDPVAAIRDAVLNSTADEMWARSEARAIMHDGWTSLVALAAGIPHASAPRRISVVLGLRRVSWARDGDRLVHKLWDVWMAILGSEIGRAEELGTIGVDRAILLEFTRTAAERKLNRIMSGIGRLLVVQPCLASEQDGIDAAENVAPKQSVSVMLGAAWACLGTTHLVELEARLRAAGFQTCHGRLPDAYLVKLVELLVELRAPYAAWLISQQCVARPPVELVTALALGCAQAGHVKQALSLFEHTAFPADGKFDVAVICLRFCSVQRVILGPRDALRVCEALGPRLYDVPVNRRHSAVWVALNAGLVRLAGVMGARWSLSRKMQRKLAFRLVKAKINTLALRVLKDGVARGEIDATRGGNMLLSRLVKRRFSPGERSHVRETLGVLARLLRHGHRRRPFKPDAVTLNVLCRALAQRTSGVTPRRLRALFDRLSRAGLCGPIGNHFGTSEPEKQDRFIVALAELVRATSFVRHTRPLLKVFLRGFWARGDKNAARVVMGLLKAEDAAWRSRSGR